MAVQPTTTREMYGRKIKINFFEKQHRYSHDGDRKWIISVTGATGMIDKSRVLMKWASNLTKDYLTSSITLIKKAKSDIELQSIFDHACNQHTIKKEEAGDTGTQVHEWCEKYIKTKPSDRKDIELPEDENVLNGVTAFLSWVKSNKVKFIESEKMVYSKKHDYVGLLDLKAKVNGKLTLVDFKTSKRVYPEYFLQACGYVLADEEESGDKYDEVSILHFNKEDGEFEEHKMSEQDEPLNDYKLNCKVFLACLSLKQWSKSTSKWG